MIAINFDHEIYLRIKELTAKKGISGKELGTLLGLKKSPLTDWKNQKSCPTVEQLIKLCEIFAVSSDYILFGENYIRDDMELIRDDERMLLSYYKKLSSFNKDDLLVIAEAKYLREREKETAERSSPSGSKETA